MACIIYKHNDFTLAEPTHRQSVSKMCKTFLQIYFEKLPNKMSKLACVFNCAGDRCNIFLSKVLSNVVSPNLQFFVVRNSGSSLTRGAGHILLIH